MRKKIISPLWLICFALTALAVGLASAQEATEIFIPIGQSPGLSKEGKTIMGTVFQVNKDGRLSIVWDEQFFVVRTDNQTQFYIDRSHLKQSNSYGEFKNIVAGAFVETYSPTGVAKWVKVRGQ